MEHQESANRSMTQGPSAGPFIVQGEYSDFDEFADSVRDWNLDFRQLDRGTFRADVLQIGLGGVQIGRARLGRTVHQHGDPPPGMRAFVLPGNEQQDFEWRGQRITSSRLMVFPSNAELESVSRPGFSVYTVSVNEDLLGALADSLELPSLDRMLAGSEVVELLTSTMQGLRCRMREICHLVEKTPGWLSSMESHGDVESLVPIQILLTIAAGGGFEASLAPSQKRRALERALDHMVDRVNEPVTVSELCQVTGASQRTLRRAFLEELGMPPSRYLKAVRLQGVRQELRSTHPHPVTISDVANRWGFWHMGQFAADYKREFGELPSESRERCRVQEGNEDSP